MRFALDSNVLIYAEGLTDDPRNEIAQDVLEALPAHSLIIPLQAAAETLRWLIRKAKVPHKEAVRSMSRWTERYPVQPTDEAVMAAALELVSMHHLQVFDAIILAAASHARADFLLSEDMQDGFRWSGVTIANPFAQAGPSILHQILKLRDK